MYCSLAALMYYDIILLSSRSIIGTATGSSYIPIIFRYLYNHQFLVYVLPLPSDTYFLIATYNYLAY
nr:MAG TPA: hypothetical protein [Caudoviricetes sp.]